MKVYILIISIFLLSSCGQNYHITQNEGSFGSTPGTPDNPTQPNPPGQTSCTDQATASPTIALGTGTSSDPYIICNIDQLQLVNNNLAAYYELGQDIDASITSTWTTGTSGTGFIPIGGCGSNYTDCSIGRQYFSGSFNGNGYTISNLTINRTRGAVGLFGATAYCSVVTNLRLTNADITGSADTGGIVARLYSELSKAYFGGTVSGGSTTGGLAGRSNGHIFSSSSSATVNCSGANCGGGIGDNRGAATIVNVAGSVSGTTSVGGFAGHSEGFNSAKLTSVNSSVVVSGASKVGGLFGAGSYSTTIQSSATGDVNATGSNVGGFIGYVYGDNVFDSFATGDVMGVGNVGGFIGQQYYYYGYNYRSFATGNVDGGAGNNIGAFVGLTVTDSKNHDSFATGTVTGTGSNVGGFVGNNAGGTQTNSYHSTLASTFHNMAHPVYASWNFVTDGGSRIWAVVNSALPRFGTLSDETISLAGSGTETDPYIINSPADFNSLQSYATRTAHLRLGSDLDFTAPSVIPLGGDNYPFLGNINGNSRAVSNIDNSLIDSAIFSNISNLTITSSTVSSSGTLTDVCSHCEINNMNITSTTINGPGSANSNVGGMVGAGTCINISNANVSATVNVNSYGGSGGVIGSLGGTIKDSTVDVTINGGNNSNVGGFAGRGGIVLDSTITGSINSPGGRSGGIFGLNASRAENLNVDIDITSGFAEIGGVIGFFAGGQFDVKEVAITGDLITNSNSGPIIGHVSSAQTVNIENSYVTGSFQGRNSIGGFIGQANGAGGTVYNISNSYHNPTSFTQVGGGSNFNSLIGNSFNSPTLNITNVFSTSSRTNITGGGATMNDVNVHINQAEAPFYSPTHPVYTGNPVWNFTDIWNSPGGVSLPTHQ